MLLDKTIEELSIGLNNGEFTSVDLINECFQSIEKLQPKLNAFITIVDKNIAREDARKKIQNGPKTNPAYMESLLS